MEVLHQVLQHLDTRQQTALRGVCQHLAAAVAPLVTHASVLQNLSRPAAQRLHQRLPSLSSLSYKNPGSTQFLHLIPNLTKVCLAPSQRIHHAGAPPGLRVDLAPLQRLPRLHTLQLEQIEIPQLIRSRGCALATLTQLQALHLTDCSCPFDLTRAGRPDTPFKPQDMAALPGVTSIRIVDRSHCGLSRMNGLQNLQRVLTLCIALLLLSAGSL